MKNILTALLTFCSVALGLGAQLPDSVFTKQGDTLVGTIRIDKDNNKFFFSNKAFDDWELKPDSIASFVAYPNAEADEQRQFSTVITDFYMLESGKNADITIYSRNAYQAVTNDGPKYYLVKKRYCLIKNNAPYFPDSGNFKEIMLFLTQDCFKIQEKFRLGEYNFSNYIEGILAFNRCRSGR